MRTPIKETIPTLSKYLITSYHLLAAHHDCSSFLSVVPKNDFNRRLELKFNPSEIEAFTWGDV